MWKQRTSGKHFRNALEALEAVNKTSFGNVFKILRILALLPVSIASPERSFSSLKRIKTYLRNTTGQDRLNGLASMNIHRDIDLSVDEILEEFFQKPRKI